MIMVSKIHQHIRQQKDDGVSYDRMFLMEVNDVES